jgi:hypothetical protein
MEARKQKDRERKAKDKMESVPKGTPLRTHSLQEPPKFPSPPNGPSNYEPISELIH